MLRFGDTVPPLRFNVDSTCLAKARAKMPHREIFHKGFLRVLEKEVLVILSISMGSL
jgi:hypothetical protein